MFASTSERQLFPTTVWLFDLEPAQSEPLNQQLLKDLNTLTSPRPALRPGQNWQTEQRLHLYEEFAALVDVISSASKTVLELLQVDYEAFEITGCWANMNPRNAFHITHTHPNNYLSGIYYAQAAPGANNVSFHEPRMQVDIISPQLKASNRYNEMVTDVEVKPGRLVIFPAWLPHSVKSNQSETIRISFSFNIMISDFTGAVSPPKWSGLKLNKEPNK